MPSRGSIMLCTALGLLAVGLLIWRSSSARPPQPPTLAPVIVKQPITLVTRTFDPAAPPAEMPPLSPGEIAECDSSFVSNASLRGEPFKTDATHATVTITQVKITLGLNITIWLPVEPTKRVIEHEDGHRQISEFYYQTADKLVERIATNYMGKQFEINGADLDAESNKMLHQMAAEVVSEYGKQLDPGPTQLLYDTITDHGRNDVVVVDALAHAIRNVAAESSPGP